MRSDRFRLWTALLAAGVGVVSFAVALYVLDDGRPDAPPSASSIGAEDTTVPPIAPTSTSTTTSVSAGPLTTPAWVAIVASEKERAPADAAAAEVAARGYPSGVLRSDDYPSLSKGLWVGYAGPYANASAADAAVTKLETDGIDGAYVRCVGTKHECAADNGDQEN